ncbi:TetR family transcriptional regulator [uncultured Microbacterium sp.]|uniref:TetR family transcriptional regulator n=1 Tax=uncultured Microbacterium sp. TaxID=191216 RepID=UPI0028DC7DD3|nr:TetR family transcriptional regulator [uncultured Microbacterium sp.]
MTPASDDAASARRGKVDVVDAAMAVLDEHGIAGLSMRRIADALDLQVSALYWHFPNKQALLAAVSARIVGGADAVRSDDLADIAAALRDRLLAHRDGAEIVSSSLALGLLDLPARTRLVDAARGAGLADAAARVAADTLVHFVIGFTFHEQQRLHAAVVGAAAPVADLSPEAVGDSPAHDFAAGLELIVSGIRTAARA